jgi:hypothetical protein
MGIRGGCERIHLHWILIFYSDNSKNNTNIKPLRIAWDFTDVYDDHTASVFRAEDLRKE